ncbi:MICAL-like protein 2 isoform X1 [Strigops habroptila]|uniref:MICAL-like protein 2 isoform X1 n=3 Tax=Strigops habroptila TaxID=2489341 RepID=UPI0011CFAF0E|nr:MICAL-like protein 2 isoform X1 [Strigops habroptila]XP_030339710.1 MICAL-like protein 2 isoform X1 [Strigops habroptila]
MAAIQNLQLWCKQQCEGYRDVNITNMTTSFRDGLAFCAILHRHRPDLINFNSLSKENVYENNKLAFQVAEKELGIPALLDAEDMVALRVPDRLSILTYVSQYYNYFHGRSPIGGMAGIKRPSSEPQEQPLGKKAVSEPPKPAPPKLAPAHPPARAKPKETSPVTTKGVLADSGNIPSSSCGVCGNHVHLVQRYLVDGKLYHRNCFRCRQCWNVLLPGSYKPGPEPNTFICISHQQPDSVQISGLRSIGNKPESTPAPAAARAFQKAAEPKKPEQVLKKPSQEGLANSAKPSVSSTGSSGFKSVNTPWSSSAVNKSDDCKGTPLGNKPDHREGAPPGPLWTTSTTKTQQARDHFFQSLESSSNKSSDTKNQVPSHGPGKTASAKTTTEVRPVNAVKDQARNHIIQALAGSNSSPNRPGGLSSTGSSASSSGKFSPTSSRWQSPAPKGQSSKIGYTALKQEKITDPLPKSQPASSKPVDSVHKPESKGIKGSMSADEYKSESPADWRSRLKPVANKDQGGSKKPTDNSQVGTGSPEHKETKPTPLVVPSAKQDSASSGGFVKKKLIPSSDLIGSFQNSKQGWEDPGGSSKKEQEGNQLKKSTTTVKPSVPKSTQRPEAVSPTKLHPDYLPEEEIQDKVRDIEKQLDELELKGVDLEKQLRGCEGDESEDALMVDWFKLIHEKQLLLRQESELMYKMKQQKLEEQQWNIEMELRHLMSKPEELKTNREKEREKELLESYLNTVNDRNSIVECLDEDRLREREEDQMLADMIQKLDGSLAPGSREKKNKFSFSKIWKSKNKSKAQE